MSIQRISQNVTILLVSLLIVSLLIACTAPTGMPQVMPIQPSETVQGVQVTTERAEEISIQPGDTVNGVLVTTGNAKDEFLFDKVCQDKGEYWICQLTTGDPVHITDPVYGTSDVEVNSQWETFSYTLNIENQPVDAPAFGTLDFVHKRTGYKMRAYDVVLVASEPLTLTINANSCLGEDCITDTALLVFNLPTKEELIQPLSTAPGRPGQHAYTFEQTGFELLLYLPGKYGKVTEQTWPLILYLHGFPDITTLDWVRIKGLPLQLENQQEFPFIVASPLHTGQYQHWSQPKVQQDLTNLIIELQDLLEINPDQIYLTGFLEGGNGVWELGLAHPEIFAALAPVGGWSGYPFSVPKNICDLKNMPIWAFHGADDNDLPPSAQQMLVDALKACGNQAKFTIYPGAITDIYQEVFANPELFEWLKEQKRNP